MRGFEKRRFRKWWQIIPTMVVFLLILIAGCTGKSKAPKIVISENENIYLMNEDGSEKIKIIEDGITPKFSSDGKTIVYVGKEKPKDKFFNYIFIYNLISKKKRGLIKGIDPSFSPDGKRISYVWIPSEALSSKSDDEEKVPNFYLKTITVDGGKETSIAALPTLANPSWSPNGEYIIFDSSGREPFSAIFKVKADGSNFAAFQSSGKISKGSEEDELAQFLRSKANEAELSTKFGIEKENPPPPMPLMGDFPVYSPDGKRIAFTSLLDEEPELSRNKYELWLFDFDSKSMKKLLPADHWRGYPVWSPDGKKIAFVNKKLEGKELEDSQAIDWDKGAEIWIIDVENPTDKKTIKMPAMVDGLDWRR